MVIPTTGIVFLFGAFVFIYLSRRFYQCYKAENNRVAKLFSYSFFLIGLNYIVSGIPSLLLIESHDFWKFIAPSYFCFLAAGWILLGFTVFSNRLPKYAKIIGIVASLIFIISVLPFFFQVPNYYYTDGALSWDFGQSTEFPQLFFISLATIPFALFPLIIIFFWEARKTTDKKAKIRSLGFGIALGFMFLGTIIDSFLLTLMKVHPIYSDLNYFVIFIVLAITLLFSWFSPRPKWVKKIE